MAQKEHGSSRTTVITRWLIDTRHTWSGGKIQDTARHDLSLVSDSERAAILRKYQIADAKMSLASALVKRAYIVKCLHSCGITNVSWSKINFIRAPDPVHGKPKWNPPDRAIPGMPWPHIDFNVSHQGGLVTLVGACTPSTSRPLSSTLSTNGFYAEDDDDDAEEDDTDRYEIDQIRVGCDIVFPNERGDLDAIRDSDFDSFTSAFSEVFSHEELYDITYNLPSHSLTLLSGHRVPAEALGRLDRLIICDQDVAVKRPGPPHGPLIFEQFSSDLIIDAKLRRFYTFFSLKEAYIKLVGEGLLAPWIKEAEFRNVRAPRQGSPARCSTHGAWGGKAVGGGGKEFNAFSPSTKNTHSVSTSSLSITSAHDAPRDEDGEGEQLELWLHGHEVHDVRMEVQAFEEDFMITTMFVPASVLASESKEFPAWQTVDLERDIVSWATISEASTNSS
jgi:4'-phosphopantetheinyl transferase